MVLYTENVFSIEFLGHWIILMRRYFNSLNPRADSLPIRKMKNLRILIKLPKNKETLLIDYSTRLVCKLLQERQHLRLLKIRWDDQYLLSRKASIAPVQYFLEPFSSLRNLQSVTLENVPETYAKYLERCMTRSQSQGQLPKMLEALQSYVRPFERIDRLMQEACAAKEDQDLERFKEVRAQVINLVDPLISATRKNPFLHDVDSNKEDSEKDSEEDSEEGSEGDSKEGSEEDSEEDSKEGSEEDSKEGSEET